MIAVDIAKDVARNALMGVPAIRTARVRRGRTSAAPDINQLDRYAFPLLKLALARGPVQGYDVCEIGPGDHLSSGLSFLAAGAKSYDCLDRFPGPYNGPQARSWYRLVRAEWARNFPQFPWPKDLDVESFPQGCPRVNVCAQSVESLKFGRTFDLVLSYAVGEHVSDVKAFAQAIVRLMKPSGLAIHVIDFSPHASWPDKPFLFRCIPSPVWRAMGSNRGLPNRVLYHDFRATFEACGLEVEIENRLHVPGPIPAKLQHLPEESLRTGAATFFMRRRC